MCSTSTGTEEACRERGARRRALLAGGLAAGLLLAAAPGLAHTPYRQWKVYRQRHLMLGASREDPATYPLAKGLQALLEDILPEASARVARARTRRRLADLLATDQIHAILLSAADARALAEGTAPFAAPVEIRAIERFGDHVLVASPSFPAAHAWALARSFLENGDRLPGPREAAGGLPVPLHEGALVARDGGGQPAPPEPPPAEGGHGDEVHF